MIITQTDIQHIIRELGLSRRPVCAHASLHSLGQVAGGPLAVVEAFSNEGCTLMLPSFSWTFAVAPPKDQRPPRNGWDYETDRGPFATTDKVYSPTTQEVDRDMGSIAATVVALPERVRGCHPLCSFSAVGPLADKLVSGQNHADVCAPLSVLAREGGHVLLMGLGLESMTLLHLAEREAGRTLFRRWANRTPNHAVMVEVGGCSEGFRRLEPHLAHLRTRTMVGPSLWHLYPARGVLEAATKAIGANPDITHCRNERCERCNDAVAGGPIL
ncbi:MAG: AAC(3) family N-acetyltransferase [Gammaproteobacteria bacterium]